MLREREWPSLTLKGELETGKAGVERRVWTSWSEGVYNKDDTT